MRDLLDTLACWLDEGHAVALATVVGVQGSAPRPPGVAMAVRDSGAVVGSVSGGCVEGAVYQQSLEVLRTGVPVRKAFGYSDDDAFAVGLTCGGSIEVWIERVEPGAADWIRAVRRAVEEETPLAVVTRVGVPGGRMVVSDDAVEGSLGAGADVDQHAAADAREVLKRGDSLRREYPSRRRSGADGSAGGQDPEAPVAAFVSSFAPRPRLLVFGAIDHAGAVARMGRFLGYRVTVCDARATFATAARFPDADEVVVDWPNRYLGGVDVGPTTAICVLTHDPRFDLPLLERALRTPAVYVGAMGSRRTHLQRMAELRRRGVDEEALARLHSPIGLDLGGSSPEETAVSIAAELIRTRCGGSGASLRETEGPIHATAVAPHPLAGQAPAALHGQTPEPRVPPTARDGPPVGILLAAGAGTRMGRAKALVPFHDEPLVRRGVRLLRAGGCHPVLVVVGAEGDAAATEVGASGGIPVVSESWRDGLSASLAAGLDAASERGAPAVVVMPVDQPLVAPAAVEAVIRAWRKGATLAVATWDGQPGHPALFDACEWPIVRASATGDQGARDVLRGPRTVRVPCDDHGALRDADTPEELLALADEPDPNPPEPRPFADSATGGATTRTKAME